MKKTILVAFITALIVLVVGGGGIAFLWYSWNLPATPGSTITQDYTVAPGMTLNQVATDLQTQGLLKKALILRLQARLRQAPPVQTGTHRLSAGSTPTQILTTLTSAPEQVTITILPGWRREEIATYLAEQMNLSNFDPSAFLAQTANLEGRLAANTFQVLSNITTEEVVDLLERQFELDITAKYADLQAASGKTWTYLLTLASILEREARGLEEMQVVAGLLEKRLTEGMPLQLCATLQYCRGQTADGKYWNPPRAADKSLDCIYNTYLHPGLPPGPISTVSPTAVAAALTPVASDYYFYIHGDDGQVHYARDLDEHNQNIEAYLK